MSDTWKFPTIPNKASQVFAFAISLNIRFIAKQVMIDLNQTFCILPWIQLNITIDGSAKICSRATDFIFEEGKSLSLEYKSFEEIWNSHYMTCVRRAMLDGQKVSECRLCYAHETITGTSTRLAANAAWLSPIPTSEQETEFSRLKAQTEMASYRVYAFPKSLSLWLSKECNLKCRMCSATLSSALALDPVHCKWRPASKDLRPMDGRRLPEGMTWSDSTSVIFGELFRDPTGLEALCFYGGEPFLGKQLEPILQHLIENGRASSMSLYFASNGTIVRPSLMEKLGQFYKIDLEISLDGVGDVNEYIRYPSRWVAVEQNLKKLRELRNVDIKITPTIQAYNALSLTDLLRYCDREGVAVELSNVLVEPAYLSIAILPPLCREEAKRRLESYLLAECTAINREAVQGVINHLEAAPSENYRHLVQNFVAFTRDLDSSRSQSLKEVEPLLLQMMTESLGSFS